MKLTSNKLIILSIAFLSVCYFCNTSALSYQSTSQVEFTLNPTITISVSDLSIPSLSPGDSKDSNIINVVASSNATSGYALYSNVGSSNNSSTELRKDGTDTTHKFTSLLTSDSLPALVTDNTWGYSYSNDNGTTWTNYSGLPLYLDSNDKKLASDTTAGTTTISFKIAAKASTTLVAGEYTNTINFIGIANNNPSIKTLNEATKMQDDFSCLATDEGVTNSLIDERDGKSYDVVRFKDGKCWMTTNLDLAGGTALSAVDTDVDSTYIENFTTSNNLTKEDDTIILPESSTTGFDTNNYSYVFNSNNATSNCSAPGCYSYYSWDAATLGSGRSITANNVDAPYSICPKGWHLPTTRNNIDSISDFRILIIFLGGTATIDSYGTNTNPTGATIFNSLTNVPLNFLRPGYYNGASFNYGNYYGLYWSATSRSDIAARYLGFISTIVGPADSFARNNGFAIRCLKSS